MDAPSSPAADGNRLRYEKSPYLLQHAHNPVDWYPWGEEAFEKARREDKPIFLSIGYSTCHWCHVMAHESFEDPATAAVMNELFVNIKLDREERPDVDRVYMTFVQATSGSGGWPMSVWLQPDLKPIAGGTYFPPDDRYGRRGFASVCRTIDHAWKNDRAKVVAQGDRILEALRDYARPDRSPAAAGGAAVPIADVLRTAVQTLASVFDPEWGGFGSAPKFPRPVTLQLLAVAQARLPGEEGEQAREMLFTTLDRMATGGMYDHLGGGFHRYSVDRSWHVPHFEKMLYDQAQLVFAYLDAKLLLHNGWEEKDPSEPSSPQQSERSLRYQEVIHETLEYVRRDLTSPEGGFYCAEDADSLLVHGRPEHAEGAFYVWTQAEIEAALASPLPLASVWTEGKTKTRLLLLDQGTSEWFESRGGTKEEIDTALTPEEIAAFCARFSIKADGNAPAESDPHGEFTGKNILFQERTKVVAHSRMHGNPPQPSPTTTALEKLFLLRAQRPRPHLDDKIVTAWNGLMISAFARGCQVQWNRQYLEPARRAADFVRRHLYREANGVLLRSYRQGPAAVEGFADDYAFLIQGLLDLYETGFDIQHLLWAERLQDKQDELFYDTQNGGYFSSREGDPNVLLRLREDHDGAEPSASSVSARNLLRLAVMRDRDDLRQRAAATVTAFGAAQNPARTTQTMPLMLVALDALSTPPRQIVVAGKNWDGERDGLDLKGSTWSMLRTIYRRFLPNRVLLLADGGEGQRELARRLPYLESVAPLDGKGTGYLCENGTCQLPTTDRRVFRDLL